jgi:hypothetical protein
VNEDSNLLSHKFLLFRSILDKQSLLLPSTCKVQC